MTRDRHAAYLSDPAVMVPARDRCAVTGEDGWAAAVAVAVSLPRQLYPHDSADAHAVLLADLNARRLGAILRLRAPLREAAVQPIMIMTDEAGQVFGAPAAPYGSFPRRGDWRRGPAKW